MMEHKGLKSPAGSLCWGAQRPPHERGRDSCRGLSLRATGEGCTRRVLATRAPRGQAGPASPFPSLEMSPAPAALSAVLPLKGPLTSFCLSCASALSLLHGGHGQGSLNGAN